jgi:hypothetical protein
MATFIVSDSLKIELGEGITVSMCEGRLFCFGKVGKGVRVPVSTDDALGLSLLAQECTGRRNVRQTRAMDFRRAINPPQV